MTEDSDLRVPLDELDFEADLVHKWQGRPFTGTAYEEVEGEGLTELAFIDGFQDGPSRDWYLSGKLRREVNYREGIRHGVAREYDDEGRLVAETVDEYGIELRFRRWGSDGQLIESHDLAADSPLVERLEQYRREWNWPRVEGP
jgi:hypothetical protein